jgi:predicted ester cyclase
MSTEANKAVVRRLFEAVNEQNLDELDELLAPDLAQYLKQQVIPWVYATFAGHQITITDLIAEGDKVVARLATSGGHTGEWRGIPPTGKQWTNTGVYFPGRLALFLGPFGWFIPLGPLAEPTSRLTFRAFWVPGLVCQAD